MRKIHLLLISCLLLNTLGCAPLLVGAAVGVVALGGYAVSKDTIQGDTDKAYNSLWDAALMVGRIKGNIKYEDHAKGYIELKVGSSRVFIHLIRLTRAATRLRISARKYRLPNMELAQDIYVKIMEQAR